MLDPSDVDAMLNTPATDRTGSGAADTVAGFTEADAPTAAARAGSVHTSDYTTSVGSSALSRRELAVLTEEPGLVASADTGDADVTSSFANCARTQAEDTLLFT